MQLSADASSAEKMGAKVASIHDAHPASKSPIMSSKADVAISNVCLSICQPKFSLLSACQPSQSNLGYCCRAELWCIT